MQWVNIKGGWYDRLIERYEQWYRPALTKQNILQDKKYIIPEHEKDDSHLGDSHRSQIVILS
jgi:hypothetical protein